MVYHQCLYTRKGFIQVYYQTTYTMKSSRLLYTGSAYAIPLIALMQPCLTFSISTDPPMYTTVLHLGVLAPTQPWPIWADSHAQPCSSRSLSGLHLYLTLAQHTISYKLNSTYAAVKWAEEVVLAVKERLGPNNGRGLEHRLYRTKKYDSRYSIDKWSGKCGPWQSEWTKPNFKENNNVISKNPISNVNIN